MRKCVPDRTTGAQRFLLGGDDDLDPEVGVIEELTEDFRSITRCEDYARDSCITRPRDLVNSERDTCDGKHRFGCADGQRAQPSSLAADE